MALGRNRYIAWGATNVAADVQDLYRERLDESGRFAEFDGHQEPIAVFPETIVVKGADPVVVNVRVTRHGPLISDAINANTAESKTPTGAPPLEPLAFRWTALDPDDLTITAYMRLNEARTWKDVTTALRDYATPSQNFVFAEASGHIGYYAPGHIPVRAAGDGSQPTDGWTGDTEWTGYVPFEELPHVYDPPSHMIVSANNRPSGAHGAPMIALDTPTRTGQSGSSPCCATSARPGSSRPTISSVSRPTRCRSTHGSCCRACWRTSSPRPRSTGRPWTSSAPGTMTPAEMRPLRRSSRPGSCAWHRPSWATSSAR